MRLTIDRRVFTWLRAKGGQGKSGIGYAIADVTMMGALAIASASLLWALVTPLGPVGSWQSASTTVTADESVLTRFDPFGRLGGAGPAVVTNLSVKLFGVRLDGATGLGSAIIAGPDGVQQSIGVGEEVVPGVKLKSVRIDGVTLDRGGSEEQVFLDQSATAPGSVPAAPPPGASPIAPPPTVMQPSTPPVMGQFDRMAPTPPPAAPPTPPNVMPTTAPVQR